MSLLSPEKIKAISNPSTLQSNETNHNPHIQSYHLTSWILTKYRTDMHFWTMVILGALLFATALAVPKDIRGYMSMCTEGGCDPAFFVCKVYCFGLLEGLILEFGPCWPVFRYQRAKTRVDVVIFAMGYVDSVDHLYLDLVSAVKGRF